VFVVALPCLVIRGLGIGVSFYSQSFLWSFIVAFIVLRVFALVVSFLLALPLPRERLAGEVVVQWLVLTWLSTIILGVPILTAVLGDPKYVQRCACLLLMRAHYALAHRALTATPPPTRGATVLPRRFARSKGLFYGLLASISSFIFQLPAMLFMLETHKEARDKEEDGADEAASTAPSVSNKKGKADFGLWPAAPRALRPGACHRTWLHVGRNPVLIGIAIAFFVTLSTLGPRFLNPLSPERVPGLGWIASTAGWLGDGVSPISLFAMGVWMRQEGLAPVHKAGVLKLAACMLAKCVLVPLVMVGIASMLELGDEPGRAAVLIAALPIAIASFTLGKTYGVGEVTLAANVTIGTVLLLPTILCWVAAMDAVGLYVLPLPVAQEGPSA
jgi:predicted permease